MDERKKREESSFMNKKRDKRTGERNNGKSGRRKTW
jgi:hypothetical protein